MRHAAGPGFKGFCERHELPFTSAAEFRQRYLIDAVVSTIKATTGA